MASESQPRVVLVDSNVLLDVITEDPEWLDWSSRALEDAAETALLAINPIIFAEVSVRFERIEELDEVLSPTAYTRLPLPWAAGFLAGKCFVRYRRDGGLRRSPLPDFYIGAHASVGGFALLTRDATRYSRYFPSLELIAP